jgi:hypothetical protein
MQKNMVAKLVFCIGMISVFDQVQASTCSGGAVNSCSAFAFTSTECPNYYMNSGIQCKWNGSYCSDGGPSCTPKSIPKCQGTYYAGGCSTIPNVTSSNYTSTCGTLTQNSAFTHSGSDYFQCTWDEGHSPANCSDSGTQCSY